MRRPRTEWRLDIAYMIDQSHNLKGKMEAMVQTVVAAQELYLKAALVDREQLSELQQSCDLVAAEELFRGAFWEDVRPLVGGLARGAGIGGRSAGGAARERLCGAHGAGAGQPVVGGEQLRLRHEVMNCDRSKLAFLAIDYERTEMNGWPRQRSSGCT